EVVAEGEHVALPPRLLIERREAVAAEDERQRRPPLRERAALRLQAEVAGEPVAVARREVRELIEGGRLLARARDRHDAVDEHQRERRGPAVEEPRAPGSRRRAGPSGGPHGEAG